jgi:hypothetical protein
MYLSSFAELAFLDSKKISGFVMWMLSIYYGGMIFESVATHSIQLVWKGFRFDGQVVFQNEYDMNIEFRLTIRSFMDSHTYLCTLHPKLQTVVSELVSQCPNTR